MLRRQTVVSILKHIVSRWQDSVKSNTTGKSIKTVKGEVKDVSFELTFKDVSRCWEVIQ